MTPDDLGQEVIRIRAALFGVPPERLLAALKEELSKVSGPYRGAVEALVLSVGYEVGKSTAEARMNKAKQYERWAAYGFGVVFLLILFVVVLLRPNPTAFQYLVFRVLLALAAAGIAAFIPGFLEVELSPAQTIAIRAGGAIAVFVLVYFCAPAQLLPPEKSETLRPHTESAPPFLEQPQEPR